MDRRQFSKTLASALAVAAVPEAPFLALGRHRARTLTLNGARLNRHLKELSAFGANPQGGVSRVAYSDADRAGRLAQARHDQQGEGMGSTSMGIPALGGIKWHTQPH